MPLQRGQSNIVTSRELKPITDHDPFPPRVEQNSNILRAPSSPRCHFCAHTSIHNNGFHSLHNRRHRSHRVFVFRPSGEYIWAIRSSLSINLNILPLVIVKVEFETENSLSFMTSFRLSLLSWINSILKTREWEVQSHSNRRAVVYSFDLQAKLSFFGYLNYFPFNNIMRI